jgi:putative membrane protein
MDRQANKGLLQYGALAAKGFAMGAANVIPGVSGGTIAFITGIYDDLIHALKSMDLAAVSTSSFPF